MVVRLTPVTGSLNVAVMLPETLTFVSFEAGVRPVTVGAGSTTGAAVVNDHSVAANGVPSVPRMPSVSFTV